LTDRQKETGRRIVRLMNGQTNS